jgi:drug/metabolite transporter (DMT)-like permease
MVVALALGAALFYGAADFCGGLASRRGSTLAVVVWSQAIGLIVLTPALPFVPGTPHASDFVWGAVCGVAGAFAIGLFYRALAVGVMGVVSPLTAVLAATIPVGWGFVFGQRPASLAMAGIGCALVAVLLVSASTSPLARAAGKPLARAVPRQLFAPGILEALGAGAAFGFFFIALSQTHADGGLYPLVGMRLASLVALVAFALVFRGELRVARAGVATIVLTGVLDMTANIFYVVAVHAGALAIVAVITSLYPAGTVALAAIVLHERLIPVQWLGVAIAFTGVLCIALAR